MKQGKKMLAFLLAAVMVLLLASCGQKQETETKSTYPNPVLLVVSFGTSYNDSRDVTIGAVESALRTAYPDYEVRQAFTSQTIIDILAKRDNLHIDNVTQAMEKMAAQGVKQVVIQPTTVMSGFEYSDMVKEVSAFSEKFESLSIGMPLLSSDNDYTRLAKEITGGTAQYDQAGTAVVFMGHGTGSDANSTYTKLQQTLASQGHSRYFIGTVEATPTLADVMADVKASGATKVVLLPLMIVAGDHANNDMAGNEPDSWKMQFKSAGYDVECVIKGLAQMYGVRQMFVDHAAAAMGLTPAAGTTDTAAPAADGSAQTPAQTAGAVQGSQIADGTYTITVDSDSSMFKVTNCELKVEKGAMTAVVTLSGQGYDKLFLGTAEAAGAAEESQFIPAVDNAAGEKTYALPIQLLDTDVACAAWSIKKETWYDRTLVFHSADLPAGVITK
ncbi:MAG: sirohydrochlorin cobaltochelatase [Oscillibacter sp.]|nr:sirohydrochlorin cobaltochelatase [Oscillibacter sp.]